MSSQRNPRENSRTKHRLRAPLAASVATLLVVGLGVGAHETFALPPGDAFGPRNGDLVRRVPRALLEAESGRSDYSSGDAVEFNAPGGGRYAGVFRSFEGEDAIFDFNHPLAGQALRFEVNLISVL